MADEKSCGAIVYTYEKGVRKYVIIRGTGIYKEFCGFPKGHMEPGETETETALREVKEETGLDVSILDGFKTMDEHFLAREGRPNEKKTNVYYLAEYVIRKSRHRNQKSLRLCLWTTMKRCKACSMKNQGEN